MKSIMSGMKIIIIFCWFLSPAEGVNALWSPVETAISIGRMLSPPNGNQLAKRPSGSERSPIQRNGAYLSSTAERSTLKSAMKTGIWMSIGRHELIGLTFASR